MRILTLDRRFDAITCLFGSIGYMGSTAELNAAVAAMAAHLQPGGVLIVDGWVQEVKEWPQQTGTDLSCSTSTHRE